MEASAIQKNSPIKCCRPFANTTRVHLHNLDTPYNFKSYNTFLFTIKNYVRNKLFHKKIYKTFSATAYNKE